MTRSSPLLPALLLLCGLHGACSGEIYLRDGLTDGDTFYLAERALVDDDPRLQSWVSYSLSRSACKLAIGGSNPARASSYQCELIAREHLLETWRSKDGRDPYLDALSTIAADGWLPEYIVYYFREDHWQPPNNLDLRGFRRYLADVHPRHRANTRLVGSWNYARNVRR